MPLRRESCATLNQSQCAVMREALTTTVALSATEQRSLRKRTDCSVPRRLSQSQIADAISLWRGMRSKQPRRPHYIQEWAEKRGLTQAALARELGADKSVISRWFKGASPGEEWQIRLSALFGCEREALFRPPEGDWLQRFIETRSREEIERLRALAEAVFPERKDAAAPEEKRPASATHLEREYGPETKRASRKR